MGIMLQLLVVVRIKHFYVFKVSTQSLIHKKYAANAKESHTIPSFPHLALEPFFPSQGKADVVTAGVDLPFGRRASVQSRA